MTGPSIAEQHRDNGLAAIRNLFATIVHPAHRPLPAEVVNIDTISGTTLVVDLADGTSIRLDAERYTR